jgi:S-adenosylmethionine hydrolase
MIAFLTDWGNTHYVGICKGVIDGINPEAKVIDFTHDIEPFNVRMAAHILARYYKDFPKKTVFLCVVDAEVGTSNKRLAIETDDYYFVGPDYGIFTFIDNVKQVVELTNKDYYFKLSATFHGRDIFAPAAAYLAKGVDIKKLGKSLDTFKKIDFLKPVKDGNKTKVEVAYIDKFGNIELFCKEDELIQSDVYKLNDKKIYKTKTFADKDFNIHTDSSGYLEISKYQDRANDYFNLKSGDVIYLQV